MTSVVPSLSFEERLKEKLRESIGDMITDEDLQKLVSVSINDLFFRPTRIQDPINNYKMVEGPPLLHSMMLPLLKPIMEEQLKAWISEHQTEVQAALGKVLQDGVGLSMMAALSSLFHDQLWGFQNAIQSKLQSMGR